MDALNLGSAMPISSVIPPVAAGGGGGMRSNGKGDVSRLKTSCAHTHSFEINRKKSEQLEKSIDRLLLAFQ